jgi:hypothetical protein
MEILVHSIFLVHGMGDFAAGWSKSIQADIQKYYDPAKYAFLKDFPFAQNFSFVEITYNNYFTEYLAAAKQQASTLAKWDKIAAGLSGDVLGILQQVVTAASSAPADDFLVNYLGDVAFYMASDIGQEVKTSILEQIDTALGGANYDPSENSWSIIAHSLGTRVVTEMLQAAFTEIPSQLSYGKAAVLMQVANVSRLLQDLVPYKTGDVYHCAVYPSSTAANGVCTHFVNATHPLDPFAFIYEFDPHADFGDGNALSNGLYHPVRLNTADVTEVDVHALEHYMLHPAVHTTLFQYLLPGSGSSGPTPAEMTAAMASYRKLTLEAQVSAEIKTQLSDLQSDPFSSISQIFQVWQKYGALLKSAEADIAKVKTAL